MALLVLSMCAGAAFYNADLGLAVRAASRVQMSAVLHTYDPGASTGLSAYLEKRRCELATSFDEAPKLAHSIAIELDEALDSATFGDFSTGLTILISEADDIDVGEACLSALGCPQGASVSSCDYNQHRLVGFCCSADTDLEGASLTLINGERIAGFQPPPAELQPILEATAVLADELEEHFVFQSVSADQSIVVYGGRAPDGCIVGVLGIV